MHPNHRGMHIAIDSKLILSWNFLCAGTFLYESKTAPVCLYPEKKKKRPSFVNISPTLVIDALMERSSRVLCLEKWKIR